MALTVSYFHSMTPTGPLFHVSPSTAYEKICRDGLRSKDGLFFFDKLEAAEDFGDYWVASACRTIDFTIWEAQLTPAERAQLQPDGWFDEQQISPPHEDDEDMHGEFAVYWNEDTNAWAAWHGPTITHVPFGRLVEYALSFS